MALACAPGCKTELDNGYAVAVTVKVDASVTPTALDSVARMHVAVRGAESFDFDYNVDAQLKAREGKFLYRPGVKTGSVTFRVTLRDTVGNDVAAGESTVTLRNGKTVETTVTVSADGPIADMTVGGSDMTVGGSDMTVTTPDLTAIDLVGSDFTAAPPDLTVLADMALPEDLTVLDLTGVVQDLTVVPDLTVLPDLKVLPDQMAPADMTNGIVVTLTKNLIDGATADVRLDGVSCGPTCSKTVPSGTVVTLSVNPDIGNGFTGWPAGTGGTCSGLAFSCTITITATKDVTATIQPFNRVFYTAAKVVPGTLGTTADSICQSAATGKFPKPNTYRAFLASSTETPLAHIQSSGARGWVNSEAQARVFVDQIADAAAGKILYVVRSDQNGALVPEGDRVLTGSLSSGGSSGNVCSFWSTTAGTTISGDVRTASTLWMSSNGINCSDQGTANPRLMCFGTAYVTPVPPMVIPTTARAFVTASGYPANAGVSSFDTACRTEAFNAGLCTSSQIGVCRFLAAVASNGGSVSSRFLGTGTVWSRLDGVALAASRASFFAGDTFATLGRTSSGTYPFILRAWTGVPSGGGANTNGTNTSTCTDWSLTSGSAGAGGPYTSATNTWIVDPRTCSNSHNIYCLED